MSLLQSIHSGKRQQAPRLLIYGSEGIGKSTLAANAPKPIFISTEDGLDQIICDSFPLAKTFTEAMDYFNVLANEQHDYRTVVLDSSDWFERLVWDQVCKDFGVKNIEKADGGFHKGYVHALNYWRQLIDALRRLREEKGMLSIILAHAKVETFTDPESSAFDRFSPRLHKYATAYLCEWCDAILLATREFSAAKGDKSGGDRIFRCTPSAVGVAKNRFGFPDVLPLDWNAVYQCMIGGTRENT
jgi:adenylate kinase family enzyme